MLRQENSSQCLDVSSVEWVLEMIYHPQVEEVADMKTFYQWLEKARLKDSKEAPIMAAHLPDP